MSTGRISSSHSVGGIAFSGSTRQTAEGGLNRSVTLAAGVAGAMGPGTPAATIVDGLPTGHGLEVADLVDFHWADPTDGSRKVRRGYRVDTANANDIVFDETPTPDGDTQPAEDTAVIVSLQSDIVTAFDGDLMLMLSVLCAQDAIADFRVGASTEFALLLVADEPYAWYGQQGFTNPVAGHDITNIIGSNGSVTAATFKLGMLQDSVT